MPATGNTPDETPKQGAKPGAARSRASNAFARYEAALAASDARHARITAQRFSLLRTRILHEMRGSGWNKLAVVPVTPGAGGTYVAVHLSLALARLPHSRVALIDLDLGTPSVAQELGLPGCGALTPVLRDVGGFDPLMVELAEPANLAVMAPAQPEAGAAEILQDEMLAGAVQRLHQDKLAEIVILNTAPLLAEDTALAALPLADALLLVADGREGTAAHMAEAERLLVGMPPIMGVVLNRSED
jgi:protein-tyrosine kinase